MVLNRTRSKFTNLHRIMCLAFCLGFVCFALTGSAWAATPNPSTTTVGTPDAYASELSVQVPSGPPAGRVYTLSNAGSYNSDIYRAMGVMRSATGQNFWIKISLGEGAQFATGRLPLDGDISVFAISDAGVGGATFHIADGGTDQSTYVTYSAAVTTSFTGFPTLLIKSGTNGWTVRDNLNALANAGSIHVTVQTYDANFGTLFDNGPNDTTTLLKSKWAYCIAPALVPTSAIVDVATNRTGFVVTGIGSPNNTLHHNYGATLGIGWCSGARALAVNGTSNFALAATDTVRLSFTSNVVNGLTPLTTSNGYIEWADDFNAGAVINVAGNDTTDLNASAQPFDFRVNDSGLPIPPQLPAQIISVQIDEIFAVSGSIGFSNSHNLQAASTVTTWTVNGSVLVANWLSGNFKSGSPTAIYMSRIYIWNPDSQAGAVTAYLYSLPLVNGGVVTSAALGSVGLGTLAPTSGMNIRLAEDIITPILGAGALPYTTNGGNLVVVLNIQAAMVRGIEQVITTTGNVAYGTSPLQVIQ